MSASSGLWSPSSVSPSLWTIKSAVRAGRKAILMPTFAHTITGVPALAMRIDGVGTADSWSWATRMLFQPPDAFVRYHTSPSS